MCMYMHHVHVRGGDGKAGDLRALSGHIHRNPALDSGRIVRARNTHLLYAPEHHAPIVDVCMWGLVAHRPHARFVSAVSGVLRYVRYHVCRTGGNSGGGGGGIPVHSDSRPQQSPSLTLGVQSMRRIAWALANGGLRALSGLHVWSLYSLEHHS